MERERLANWAEYGRVPPDISDRAFRRHLYLAPEGSVADGLRLALAGQRAKAVADDAALHTAARLSRLLKQASGWTKPEFPLRGADLVEIGLPAGKAMGELLAALRQEWIEQDFDPDRAALLDRARTRAAQLR
jgi:poly(A) polymerase